MSELNLCLHSPAVAKRRDASSSTSALEREIDELVNAV